MLRRRPKARGPKRREARCRAVRGRRCFTHLLRWIEMVDLNGLDPGGLRFQKWQNLKPPKGGNRYERTRTASILSGDSQRCNPFPERSIRDARSMMYDDVCVSRNILKMFTADGFQHLNLNISFEPRSVYNHLQECLISTEIPSLTRHDQRTCPPRLRRSVHSPWSQTPPEDSCPTPP